ncbi:DUF1826 domain-containing protein [Sphingomonas hankookensis]
MPVRIERLLTIDGDRASLDRIAHRDAALAIWWRPLPEPLRLALGRLDLSTIDDVSETIDAFGSVVAALRIAGYPVGVRDLLAADIDLLLRRHAALTGDDRLAVRLQTTTAAPDDRFRADRGGLRLVCTYVGPGTEWCCVDGQDAICEVPTGAVGVFKGRALLDPPAILHRSPPCGGRHDYRLRLTIDPPQGCGIDAPRDRAPGHDRYRTLRRS